MDTAVKSALVQTARQLERDTIVHGLWNVGEVEHLQPAFRKALTEAGIAEVHECEKRLKFASWEPEGVKGRLGGVDVIVGAPPDYRAFFELKWAHRKRELGWTLWDIYKLAAGRIEYEVDAYAIVGAPLTYWADGDVDCSGLYADGVWTSQDVYRRYERAWRNLLAGGRARPVRVPATIETRLVAAERLDTSPGWELRALAVEATDTEWLSFVGDWPENHVATDA